MFEICSHSRKRPIRLALLAAVLPAALAALFFALSGPSPLSTREGRCAYLVSLGYEPAAESEELRETLLPQSFDAVLESYNRLQLAQGFDLRPAAGKKCLCASYDLENCPGWDGRVIAVLYVYRGRVIGGDVHTADVRGFLRALCPAEDLYR